MDVSYSSFLSVIDAFLSDSIKHLMVTKSTMLWDYAEGPDGDCFSLYRLLKTTVECMITPPLLDSHSPCPKFSGKYLMSPSYLLLKAMTQLARIL